jgi:hypothetical protein
VRKIATTGDMIGLYFNPANMALAIWGREKGHFKPAMKALHKLRLHRAENTGLVSDGT